MMFSSVCRLFCLLCSVGVLTLRAPSAAACDHAPAPRWIPERASPAACEPDVPLDGFVLLEGDARAADDPNGDGELEIVVQRVQGGVALETFAGEISQPDETSALFRSSRPLAPNAEYLITARRLSPNGEALGPAFTSAFTTGSRTLRPLGFRHEPSVRVETAMREAQRCSADACGIERCAETGTMEDAKLLRVAVPPIGGGLEQRPYRVSARLVTSASAGQAAVLATSDTAATQAGRRSFVVIELPRLDGPSAAIEGCVIVTASDIAGQSVSSAPICLALPPGAGEPAPSAAPAPQGEGAPEVEAELESEEADEELAELSYSETSDPIAEGDADGAMGDTAGGCAIGRLDGRSSGLTWLALGLTVALARARPRRSERLRP